ncbi:hypothetical protein RN001_000146 [Aquatica leii]|uniref:Uncharacterized protein n=1 Tax=Aquatica leii TaxID=1421715 RepID=A0AAN7SSE1_9COLE|nr:hypothetical protein RN001_000146 [Aquatica leii]
MGCDDVYIVAACRTGIGALNGQFKDTPACVLGATVIKHCIDRAGLSPDDISEIIMGQVLTAGQGQNPARQASVAADVPLTTPAYTINMLGGSSLKAIYLGYQSIRCNTDIKFVVCGGLENMTMAQHSAYIRNAEKFDGIPLLDTMLTDGLTDALTGLQMGKVSECFSDSYKISRELQDRFALSSHNKSAKSVQSNDFVHEIVPVYKDSDSLELTKDELVETDVTLSQLSEMPVTFDGEFLKSGTVTDGNSSVNGDGAAALVLCNEIQMEMMDLVPLARIVSFAQVGVAPDELGVGIVKAMEKVLVFAGWTKSDVDLYEIDEMFASQTLYVIKHLGININKVNVAGGSIALGRPLGAHGARLVVTLLHNLHRLGLNKGIAAAGVGGGMAIAIALLRS